MPCSAALISNFNSRGLRLASLLTAQDGRHKDPYLGLEQHLALRLQRPLAGAQAEGEPGQQRTIPTTIRFTCLPSQ